MTTAVLGRHMSQEGHWFHPVEPLRDASVRLYMLPHAGGGAIMYRDWLPHLPADVALRATTSPGRHSRIDEPPFQDWEPLYQTLHAALLNDLDDTPFALFGHCLGAQLAFRLATRLAAEGGPRPVLLGVSGWSPVGFFKPAEEHSRMPQEELVAYIKTLGSFPDEVADSPELLSLIVPALRADLRVASQFMDDGAGVDCPLVSYGGDADPLMVLPDAMAHWPERTPHYLGHHEYPGGHFFVEEHPTAISTHFLGLLSQVRTAPPASATTAVGVLGSR